MQSFAMREEDCVYNLLYGEQMPEVLWLKLCVL